MAKTRRSTRAGLTVPKPEAFASDLDDWLYCQRKLVLRQVLGDVETDASVRGTAVHDGLHRQAASIPARVLPTIQDAIAAHARGSTIICPESSFRSSELSLRGVPDLVLWGRGPAEVYEFKTGRGPASLSNEFGARVWNGHAAQAIAYGLLVEGSLRTRPRLLVVYDAADLKDRMGRIAGRRKLRLPALQTALQKAGPVEVPYTPLAKALVLQAINSVLAVKSGSLSPARSHGSPRRCAACPYCDRCDESLAPAVRTERPS